MDGAGAAEDSAGRDAVSAAIELFASFDDGPGAAPAAAAGASVGCSSVQRGGPPASVCRVGAGTAVGCSAAEAGIGLAYAAAGA